METKAAATEWLRFQLPRSVLPIELSRATISLTARVPSRSLEVLVVVGGEQVVVTKLSHPIGTYSIDVDRPELLQLDGDGGLSLAIRVSEEDVVEPEGEMAAGTVENRIASDGSHRNGARRVT